MRLHPAVLRVGAALPTLYDPRSGCRLSLSPAADAQLSASGTLPAALVDRALSLGLMGEPGDWPLHRSPEALLLPDRPALWHPAPLRHGPGGHDWAALPLRPAGLALWRALERPQRLSVAAARAGLSVDEATAALREFTAVSVQVVRAAPPGHRLTWQLIGPPRPAAPRPPGMIGAEGETALADWHANVTEGEGHFDEVETTVAWAFGLPHAALGGQTYGQRLAARLGSPGGLCVEVGPGSGELCRQLLDAWGPSRPARYIRVDLTPGLLAVQRARCPDTEERVACVPPLPFVDASVDLLVCNEVIADLSAAPLGDGPVGRSVADWLRRYALSPLPAGARYNVGAFALIEEIARVLAPGGAALLTEFGDEEGEPEEAAHLDHAEVGIHFGHLRQIAQACGLRARLEPVAALLGFDRGAPWLCRAHFAGLRALCRAHGQPLPARAFTVHSLPALPERVEGLVEVPLHQRGAGPDLDRFFALSLRREGGPGPISASR